MQCNAHCVHANNDGLVREVALGWIEREWNHVIYVFRIVIAKCTAADDVQLCVYSVQCTKCTSWTPPILIIFLNFKTHTHILTVLWLSKITNHDHESNACDLHRLSREKEVSSNAFNRTTEKGRNSPALLPVCVVCSGSALVLFGSLWLSVCVCEPKGN